MELPANLFGVPFDEAEVTYTAGYTVAPVPVKNACAQIVKNGERDTCAEREEAEHRRDGPGVLWAVAAG